MKIEIGNKKQFTVKSEEIFKNIPVGSVFIVAEDEADTPCIWVKTPTANTRKGEFYNAVCINADEKNLYMQCNPAAVCFVLDTDDLFGRADVCNEPV